MLHQRQQSATTSDSVSPSPSSIPSTQSPSDTSLSQSTSFDPSSSTPTTSHDPSSSTPTSTSTSTFDTRTPSSSSSSSSTPSSFTLPASSTTTPPPSSSSSSSSSSIPSVSSTLSSGFTLTTSLGTDINGSPTTIVTPVATSLHGSTAVRASPRTAIIAGSAIGGLFLFIIGLSAIFLLRRRVRRQRYWALARKRLPSRSTFLAGESMDLPQPTSPFSYSEHDDPFATHLSRGPSGDSGSDSAPFNPYAYSYSHHPDSPYVRTASPVPSSPPRLFRPRASESGSIFQESVWPPPSAASQLMDPLTSPSHAVDLGSIVNEVMGPSPRTTTDENDGGGGGGGGRTRDGSRSSETGPLLAAGDPDSDVVPTLTLTNPDPQSPLSPLERPMTPPRPPQWLSRSPNPSPKNSPLHRVTPL